ncbi:MAG TPA: DUF2505 domain-containing protein [Pseudonocardia sp.]|jgi:hypothetical protein|nr:DUF2505 domain-containing protein [Pseudonocardia sp.]
MTANVTTRHAFGHSTETVLDALADPEFHDAKVRFVGGPGSRLVSFEHDPGAAQVVILTRQRIDREELPGIARRFTRGPVYADRNETWRLSTTWSSAEFSVDVEDAPMRSGGRLSLISDGQDACTLTVRTFISVSAPLMSRSIERAMGDNVRRWLRDEHDFTRRWLAGQRA